MASFLFEVGLEEVPARMIAQAQAELLRRTVAMLERERFVVAGGEASAYSTPRRLAVLVCGVLERQEDVAEEVMGPAVKIAYKDGVAGPAAVAFAKKSGVAVEELKIVSTPKGDYVAATAVKAGRSAAEVIAAEMPKELASIYWAKNMYWRAGKPERFVRPVRWLLALLGAEVVPVSFGGYEAGRRTYGHRVLFGPDAIEISEPGEYLGTLRDASVMADVEVRRHTIRKALDRVCRTVENTRWREDHALVDKMTHMTEWPSVIMGDFEPEYLALPEEVLVTVMRDHQNYFAVETKDGKLAPHFLAVLNTVASEAGQAVIRHGNARVLRARFNDAKFFWEFDQRVTLEERVGLLEMVTFQKDLGSYAAKSLRVAKVAKELARIVAERGVAVDNEALATATRLAKTDLTTELVKEFTELQGEIGGLYARAQGASAAASVAIYEQYLPLSMEDRIPRTVEGQLLAIADKVDTISGMFGLGLIPSGSKDPFALRRAANGVVKILAEGLLPLGIFNVVEGAEVLGPAADLIRRFMRERLSFYLGDVKGHAYDVVNAVLAVEAGDRKISNDVKDALARAEALSSIRNSPDFLALSAAFKRIASILKQASSLGFTPGVVNEALFVRNEEKDLETRSRQLAPEVLRLREEKKYSEALEAIATLRPQVDSFFEAVMVMDPDEILRTNRLRLLRRVLASFSGIADFSEIVVAG
jgi:glycyl-tRNA synthetase beta chain